MFLFFIPKIKINTTTGRRLGAAAADTKRSAGYFRSCSHNIFRVGTTALAPNRSLCAGISISQ